jgi:hypothetical protein
MIVNWYTTEDATVAVSEMLIRLIFLRLFSLVLYDFFSPSPLKPCGYFICLKMK